MDGKPISELSDDELLSAWVTAMCAKAAQASQLLDVELLVRGLGRKRHFVKFDHYAWAAEEARPLDVTRTRWVAA